MPGNGRQFRAAILGHTTTRRNPARLTEYPAGPQLSGHTFLRPAEPGDEADVAQFAQELDQGVDAGVIFPEKCRFEFSPVFVTPGVPGQAQE